MTHLVFSPCAVVLASAAFREGVVECDGVASPPGHVARRVADHGILVLVRILHLLLANVMNNMRQW